MTSSKKRTSARKQPSIAGKTAAKGKPRTAKTAAAKSPAGKVAAKVVTAKKATATPSKKTVAAKSAKVKPAAKAKKVATKAAAKGKADVRKSAARKTTAKKVSQSAPRPARKTAGKKVASRAKSARATDQAATAAGETDPDTKAIVLGARRRKGTPAVFKTGSRKNTPIVFSLDDVHEILRQKDGNGSKSTQKNTAVDSPAQVAAKTTPKEMEKAVAKEDTPPVKKRVLGAASLADILGFNPAEKNNKTANDVPRKWIKYYRALMDLRNHVRDELDIHTQQTLKRSAKDDAGDLSGYGQHMADAGTDTFDRDFALSLVSNEQEALYEINEAIKRIHAGTYGVCEITGQPINRERLMAVPFTRYSLEGQRELEKNKRRTRNRGEIGVFTDTDDSGAMTSDDDSDS